MGDVRPDSPVTVRQLEVLRAIADFRLEHGYPPSVRELAACIGNRSNNGVIDLLRALKRKELVTWVPRRAGTLRLTPEGTRVLEKGGAA